MLLKVMRDSCGIIFYLNFLHTFQMTAVFLFKVYFLKNQTIPILQIVQFIWRLIHPLLRVSLCPFHLAIFIPRET